MWLWQSRQRGCFQHQRTWVRIQPTAIFIQHLFTLSAWKRRKQNRPEISILWRVKGWWWKKYLNLNDKFVGFSWVEFSSVRMMSAIKVSLFLSPVAYTFVGWSNASVRRFRVKMSSVWTPVPYIQCVHAVWYLSSKICVERFVHVIKTF